MKQKLIAIVGPTAVGKTNLSITLAKKFHGEIISADSMQVYKGMDIGTAKISKQEMRGIPHHLLDILTPDEEYSVTQFQENAISLIQKLNQGGKIPIMVGGTGLYVQAVTHHFQFSEAEADPVYRQKWQRFLEQYGNNALFEQLQDKDPEYAEQLHPNNVRRVIRALEIIDQIGESMANFQGEWVKESPYDLVMIGLTMDRALLYERINLRVDIMIQEGLVEEVKGLLEKGFNKYTTSLQAIGYKEIIQYLHGEVSKEEAIQLLKRNTRRFAKRQLTWFRRMKEIEWFDVSNPKEAEQINENIIQYIAGKFK